MLDLTLKNFMIGNIASLQNVFGTKKTGANPDGTPKGCSTEELSNNMMMPFLRRRPIAITSSTETSVVDTDAHLHLLGETSSLRLGAGAYHGVELKVFNGADNEIKLLDSDYVISIQPGDTFELRWNGTDWRVKTDIHVGDIIEQLPGAKSPIDKRYEGIYEKWSDRAIQYGISSAPPPSFVDYYAFRQQSPTIVANQRPVVCYHVPGSQWQLFRFKGESVAYTVPEELDPIKWDQIQPDERVDREACQKLAEKDPVTGEIHSTKDFAIGDLITEGPHAGKYITEVIVLGGTFPSVEGGFRPAFGNGVQPDMMRNFTGELISPTSKLSGSGVFKSVFMLILGANPNATGNYEAGAVFDPSLAVPTGNENSPRTITTRWLRRIA
jgi:hypothetical protein